MTDICNHPTFCSFAWMHRLIDTDGHVKLCCYVHEQHGDAVNLEKDWNGSYMQDIRKKMLDGPRMPMCENCWIKEDNGKVSARQRQNQIWSSDPASREIVARSIDNDYRVDAAPTWIEFRFGNLCNLKCKMCTGHSSSQIVQDSADLKRLDPDRYALYLPHEDQYADVNYNWYEDPLVWERIDRLIPHMTRITITGGEPTMIRQNIEFLKRCVKLGHADKIHVGFSTNLTNINAELLELVQQFGKTFITFSIDGTGLPYEYIRVPAKWAKIKENMIKMLAVAKNPRVICHVNMVVQLFNIIYLPDILDELIETYEAHWGDRINYCIQLTCAIFPGHFRIDKAPPIVRAVAKYRLEQWLANNTHPQEIIDSIFEDGAIRMILDQLSTTDQGASSTAILDYCRFIDQNKKIKFENHLPELHRLLTVAE